MGFWIALGLGLLLVVTMLIILGKVIERKYGNDAKH